MEALRVLIADDHPLFRHGIRTLLEATPEMEVAGEATTGEEVISLAASLQPDSDAGGHLDRGYPTDSVYQSAYWHSDDHDV